MCKTVHGFSWQYADEVCFSMLLLSADICLGLAAVSRPLCTSTQRFTSLLACFPHMGVQVGVEYHIGWKSLVVSSLRLVKICTLETAFRTTTCMFSILARCPGITASYHC